MSDFTLQWIINANTEATIPSGIVQLPDIFGTGATGTWGINISGHAAGAPPTGAAGGDLGGTYPNPSVVKINGASLGTTTTTSGNILIGSGTQWVTHAVSGDITLSSTGTATIGSNVVTYGKIQEASATTLIGNPTGSLANVEEITLGSTLVFSGTALETTALTGDVTTSANSFATTLATVNSNVGSFGSASEVGTFTVNAKGLITAASNVTISGVPPGGAAGGDLSGTYPNPTVAKINGVTLGSTTATSGNLLIGSGTQWVTNAMSGDATINSTGSLTFATVNSNVGTFGDGTHVAQVTVNGKGLITAVSSVVITGAPPSGSAGGDLSGTYPNPTVAKINGVSLGSTTATSGNLLIGSGTAWITNAMSGDITINSTGVTTLGNNVVSYAKFQQVAASSLVGNPTGSLANAQEITLGSTLTFVSSALQTLAITGDVTASANSFATTVAKINGVTLGSTTATSGNLLIGSGTQWVTNAMSGDITINSTGVTAIGSNKVTLAQMAQMATASFLGRNTASTGNVEVLSEATAKTMLNLSGTNSGDVTLSGENYISLSGQALTAAAVNLSGTNATGILAAARFPALTGDITTSSGAIATTLATVNINTGSFADATHVGQFTVNGKGLITAASSVLITGTLPGGSAGGDLTGTYPNPTIAANAVTYAKFQQVAASSLVGNPTGSLANAQGITLGTSLTFSSSTINTIQGIRTADSPTFVGLTVNTIVSAAATILALSSPAPATNVDAVGITIIASNGTGSGSSAGGPITITSGNGSGASGANGGSISITTGNGSSGASPGTLTMKAGTSSVTGGITNVQGGAGGTSSSGGGQLNLLGGAAPGLGTGGNAVITGGSASTFGTGGDVIITGGAAGTLAVAGNVRVRGGIATSGTQGAVIFDQGSVNIIGLTASNIVMTDASKNLISSSSLTLYAANDSYTYTNCGGL